MVKGTVMNINLQDTPSTGPLSLDDLLDAERRRAEALAMPEVPSFRHPMTWVAIAIVAIVVLFASDWFPNGLATQL